MLSLSLLGLLTLAEAGSIRYYDCPDIPGGLKGLLRSTLDGIDSPTQEQLYCDKVRKHEAMGDIALIVVFGLIGLFLLAVICLHVCAKLAEAKSNTQPHTDHTAKPEISNFGPSDEPVLLPPAYQSQAFAHSSRVGSAVSNHTAAQQITYLSNFTDYPYYQYAAQF